MIGIQKLLDFFYNDNGLGNPELVLYGTCPDGKFQCGVTFQIRTTDQDEYPDSITFTDLTMLKDDISLPKATAIKADVIITDIYSFVREQPAMWGEALIPLFQTDLKDWPGFEASDFDLPIEFLRKVVPLANFRAELSFRKYQEKYYVCMLTLTRPQRKPYCFSMRLYDTPARPTIQMAFDNLVKRVEKRNPWNMFRD